MYVLRMQVGDQSAVLINPSTQRHTLDEDNNVSATKPGFNCCRKVLEVQGLGLQAQQAGGALALELSRAQASLKSRWPSGIRLRT